MSWFRDVLQKKTTLRGNNSHIAKQPIMAFLRICKRGHDWLLGNVGIIPTLYRFLFWRTSLIYLALFSVLGVLLKRSKYFSSDVNWFKLLQGWHQVWHRAVRISSKNEADMLPLAPSHRYKYFSQK